VSNIQRIANQERRFGVIAWLWDLIDPFLETRYIAAWGCGIVALVWVVIYFGKVMEWVKRKIKR